MKRSGIVYSIAKKCEKPQNEFWKVGNRFFVFAVTAVGKRTYARIREQVGDKYIVYLPSVSAGDVLYLYFGKKSLEEAIGKEWIFIYDSRNEKIVKSVCFPISMGISAIDMIALNYVHGVGKIKDQSKILNGYEWCLFDVHHALPGFCIELPKMSFDKQRVDNYMEEYLRKDKKMVIIAPFEQGIRALGLPLLSLSFWQKLINSFIEKGYIVFENCKSNDEEPLLEGAIHLFPLINEIEYVANLVGNVVTIRSGFADYIRHSSASKTVLYPDEPYYLQWSIKDKENDGSLEELIYDEVIQNGIEDKFVQKIMNNY